MLVFPFRSGCLWGEGGGEREIQTNATEEANNSPD